MLESLLAIARQAKGAKSKPDNFVAICKNPAAHCICECNAQWNFYNGFALETVQKIERIGERLNNSQLSTAKQSAQFF